ncbi:MAG: GH92 family glycosyl hydrolase [Chitinophagaceae bacterium]|nr:GH92 family glycosyl hydrolase [Chitinophagaceae bacterium]MBP9740490.1 GH92 family glycosyl hydrolase [Chitinophagaceae bacterium]
MKKTFLLAVLIKCSLISYTQKLTNFVDPFLGTGGHGHVYPGATVPFGMVQLSPDNGVEGWDWCSGYHYSSKTIAGFSHTHLSGTGIGDWCDISVLPLVDTVNLRQEKILIPFSHKNESAKPGYYQVKLDNGVNCQLTSTNRNGVHQYTFPNNNGWLRFDMGFKINWDKSTAGMLSVINDSTIVGYRYSAGWAKGQKVYFAATFSQKIKQQIFIDDSIKTNTQAYGNNVKIALQFNTENPLLVRVGISSVGTDQAFNSLQESEHQTFNEIAIHAENLWEKELQKIKINTNNQQQAQQFYTALYRTCLAPVVHSDKDGSYQTHDNKQLKFTKGKEKYTVFSQWDVFRALNPLFTLTQTKRLPDMINSMLQLYEDNGLLPVWDLSTWEANTMTGYHSIPIIADAILKNIKGFNYEYAYTAMKKSAFQNQRGTPEFIQYGYVPQDKVGWSVTITLEYAFDDWCIAQVAKKLGFTNDYKLFMKRANSYKQLFDKGTGFMRAKNSNGKFVEPFDPIFSEHGFDGQYVEGTAWQHSFFVPHDVNGLATLYGGKSKLIEKLDTLFTTTSELHGENVSADVTGLIGQYAHGNEPSHHIIYMYTALDKPEKAAKWLKVVMDSMYKVGPNGLSGNDDCGQMSAWYVFTSLGFYPMNPASGVYMFGLPFINKATLQLPNGKLLNIQVKGSTNQAHRNKITAIHFNEKSIPVHSITHQQLLAGGKLIITVSK